jgi:hypothetical protein
MNIAVVFGNVLLKATTEDPGSPRILLRHNTYGDLFVKLIPNQNENGLKIFSNGQIMTTEKLTFNFTNNEQHIILPPGDYKIECWGAQGGTDTTGVGGLGGYVSGKLSILNTMTLFIYVGGVGKQGTGTDTGGYNGGGNAGATGVSGGGGGASDVRLTGGNWNDTTSLRSRIIVAGGGGGSGNTGTRGGAGGGINGISSNGAGATQTGGNAFGIGANKSGDGSGGGGGYYGSVASPGDNGAGGGSGFVSGHSGCNAINSSGGHTGQPNHYSGLVFTDTYMEAGVNDGNGKIFITKIN